MCLSDVQVPQRATTPYTAAFMMLTHEMEVAENWPQPVRILFYSSQDEPSSTDIMVYVIKGLLNAKMSNQLTISIFGLLCQHCAVINSFRPGRERERHRNADLGLQHFKTLLSLGRCHSPLACVARDSRHDDSGSFCWVNRLRWSVRCAVLWTSSNSERVQKSSTRDRAGSFY